MDPRSQEPHLCTPSVTPAPLLDSYLSRVPCRDAATIHKAPGRPLRPVPRPAAATAAGSSSQLPGPSPTSPHAPGSQLHVTTGAAEGQSRLGGRGLGAGRARSPCCSPAPAQRQGGPPGSVAMAATSSGLASCRSFSFLNLCPSKGCSPLGHLVAWLWSLRLVHPYWLFKDSKPKRTRQGTNGSPGVEPGALPRLL